MNQEKMRCPWCGDDPLYKSYHDREWGVPLYDDTQLFAMLILEGAQAGLSWISVLRRRENYFAAFDNFAVEKIVRYSDDDVARLLKNEGLIRNRLKIESVIRNAKALVKLQEERGTFSDYLWDFVDGKPIQNSWRELSEVPAETPLSKKMSRDLKKRDFSFVGPTICYAYMQAVGLVNDHLVDCFRYDEVTL